jgi:hypothetical protein
MSKSQLPHRQCRRRQLLRAGLAMPAVAATGALLTACGAAAVPVAETVVFNPAVDGWLANLAGAVAAELVGDSLEASLKGTWKKWGPNILDFIETLPKLWYWDGLYGHPKPPAVLLQINPTDVSDPMTDQMLACVDNGNAGVVFDAWAWQALAMLVNDRVTRAAKQDQAGVRDLCALTLIPSGTSPKRQSSPAGVVQTMAYEARNGSVEIDLLTVNGQKNAIIRVSGMTSDSGSGALEKQFVLPTKAAT